MRSDRAGSVGFQGGDGVSSPEQYHFQYLDHTADVAVVARGADPAGTFASAARAMFEIMADLRNVSELESRDVEVASDDLEGLLVDWLNELLFLFDTEQLLLSRFEVHGVRGNGLRATVYGERIDPARHHLKRGIKAVTYHLLEVKCEDSGCWARVLFDV